MRPKNAFAQKMFFNLRIFAIWAQNRVRDQGKYCPLPKTKSSARPMCRRTRVICNAPPVVNACSRHLQHTKTVIMLPSNPFCQQWICSRTRAYHGISAVCDEWLCGDKNVVSHIESKRHLAVVKASAHQVTAPGNPVVGYGPMPPMAPWWVGHQAPHPHMWPHVAAYPGYPAEHAQREEVEAQEPEDLQKEPMEPFLNCRVIAPPSDTEVPETDSEREDDHPRHRHRQDRKVNEPRQPPRKRGNTGKACYVCNSSTHLAAQCPERPGRTQFRQKR